MDSIPYFKERLFPPAECSAQSKKSAKPVPTARDSNDFEMTPLNQNMRAEGRKTHVDPILDDDDEELIPATSQFNHHTGVDEELFKTPSPSGKKRKFDLSELDEKN